jgi:hypothetical protein
MANQQIVLAQLDLDAKGLIKAAEDSKKAIDQLNQALEHYRTTGNEFSSEALNIENNLKRLTQAYATQQAAIRTNTQVTQQLTAGQENLISTQQDTASVMQEGTNAVNNQKKTFDDYKQQVADSFNSINVFNGGLSGFISRAQEAGGVGPLLKNAFTGITGGIKGMGAAVMANPVGAIIAAIVIVVEALYNAFKDFKPLIDKVEQGMAAVNAVIGSLKNSFLALFDPAKSISEIFSGFGSAAAKAADGAIKLKKAQQELSAEMELQEVRNKRASVLIKEQIALSENQALSEGERVAAFKRAAQMESKNYDQRKSIADKSYNAAIAAVAQGANLTDTEIANLKRGGFAYAQKLLDTKLIGKEEMNALKDLQNQREDVYAEEAGLTKSHNEGLGAIRNQYAQQRKDDEERQNNEALKRHQDFLQKQKDLLTDAAQEQKLLLDKFLIDQGDKATSLNAELKQAQDVYDFKIRIAKAEYEASDKKGNALIALHNAEAEANKDLLKSKADATLAYANSEFSLWMEQNKSQLDGKKALTDELIAQERRRLDDVKAKQLENAALNQKTSDAEIQRKKDANLQLSIEDNAYLKEKLRIEKEFKDNEESLNKTVADKKAIYEQAELEVKAATAATQYEQDVANEQIRYDAEIAKLDERKKDGLLTDQQYNALKEDQDEKHKGILQGFDDAVLEGKLNNAQMGLSAMAAILGKESAAGKAIAVAQATIDTYKSAVSAYAAGLAVGGPAGLVLGPVSAAAAVAAGIANVKKITSTKAPKAEKGALFNIGGKRHSNGGTMFTGADGTRFEAEKGELIGVMNRNAAAHFMAFNNAFPAGGSSSAPNYFAGGGIVSREIASPSLNTDELAAKIALANSKIPAPVVAVQDIITQGNSYVQVRDAANF